MMKRLLSVVALCLWCVSTSALWADGNKPIHYCTFYINNHALPVETYAEGDTLKLPVDNPGDIIVNDNLELVGWLKNRNMGDSALLNPPGDMVTLALMGTEDVEYHAVFAEPLVYRLSGGMIEKLADRDWSAAQEHRFTNFEIGGRVDWYLRGYKNAATYGNDKFIIGDEESTSSYIGFKAPKAIEKITVGALYFEPEATLKHVFKGTLYINTGINGSTVASKTKPGNAVVEFDVSSFGLDSCYLQAGGGDAANYNARIYTVKLECGLGAYRTKLDSYDLTIGPSGYSTLCLPYSADIPGGVKAYRLKEMDLNKTSGQLKFAEVSALAENQGYLIKGQPGTYRFNRIYSQLDDADLLNLMNGITEPTPRASVYKVAGEEPFVLHNGCFLQYTGETIPANKGFIMVNPQLIKYPDQTNAAELRIVLEDKEEMVTSELAECIEQIEETPEVVYDLSGRQMPFIKRRGLYIVNGKTVLVK